MFKRSGLVSAVLAVAALIVPGQVFAWGGFLTGTPSMGGSSAYGGGTKTIAATQSRSTFSAAGSQPSSFSTAGRPQTTFRVYPTQGTSFRAGFDVLQAQPAVSPVQPQVSSTLQPGTGVASKQMSDQEIKQASSAIAADIDKAAGKQLEEVKTGVTQLLTTAETILKEDEAANKNVKLDYFSGSNIKLADKGMFKDIKFTDTREQVALPEGADLEGLFTSPFKTAEPAVWSMKDGKLELVGGIDVKDVQFSGADLDLKATDIKSLPGAKFSFVGDQEETQVSSAIVNEASSITLSKSDLGKIRNDVLPSPNQQSKFSASIKDKGAQVGLKDVLTALNSGRTEDNAFVLMHVENMDKFYKTYGGYVGGSSRKCILVREKDDGSYSYGIVQTLGRNDAVATAAAGVKSPQALADYWKTGYVFVPTNKASSKNMGIQDILDDPELEAIRVDL